MSIDDQIPGLKEAREAEQAKRDLAFLDMPVLICGIPVRQFSIKHLVLLGNLGNRFVSRSSLPDAGDVAQFLWIVSPRYSLDANEREAFVRELSKISYGAALAEINEYLHWAFYDAPASSGESRTAYTSHCACLVDLIAREYGWDDDRIVDKPIARMFQYQRAIQRRYNPKALLFNRSDEKKNAWLRSRNAAPQTPEAN